MHFDLRNEFELQKGCSITSLVFLVNQIADHTHNILKMRT